MLPKERRTRKIIGCNVLEMNMGIAKAGCIYCAGRKDYKILSQAPFVGKSRNTSVDPAVVAKTSEMLCDGVEYVQWIKGEKTWIRLPSRLTLVGSSQHLKMEDLDNQFA